MHRFVCFASNGRRVPPDLQGAHLVGVDGLPVRAEIRWDDGFLRCTPRTQDPVGLSLLWPVPGIGTVQLQTTRLPARERPYNLHLELARQQLMRLTVKREEWGLFDYSGMDEISGHIEQCRQAFVQALQTADDPPIAAGHADTSLAEGLRAAEEMAVFHAHVFLGRRQQTGGFAKPFLGARLPAGPVNAAMLKPLAGICDFVDLPFVWRQIQPTEQARNFEVLEAWVAACAAAKLPVRGGPLLAFNVSSVPDWLYIWENDFESIFEAARDHVERTVKRFAKQVSNWVVASGLQADNVFGFSYEQTMELTRMAVAITKQCAPRAQVLLDVTQPWGEYFARNQQTVPPLLYADMAVQSGLNFDGFGLQFLFGIGTDGYHLRDPFQVSALIDKLANFGKPLHVTALGAPAQPAAHDAVASGGEWGGAWSEENQAKWLETLCQVALSKPYVETVSVQPLVDGPDNILTQGGLLRPDLSPRPALTRLGAMRQRLMSPSK